MRAMGVALAVSIACVGGALAEPKGGKRADVTLGYGALYQSDHLSGLAALRLGLSTETRTQSLRFDLDAARLSAIGTQAQSALRYRRKSKSSLIDLHLRYSRKPAGAVVFGPDQGRRFLDITGSNMPENAGLAHLAVHTGLGRPVGLEVDLRHRFRKTNATKGRRNAVEAGAAVSWFCRL